MEALLSLCAEQLAQLTDEEDRGGEVHVYGEQDEMDDALGTGRREYRLLSVQRD